MSEMPTNFREWLFFRYLDFLKEKMYPLPVSDFAAFLGLPRSVMSLLLSGKRPPSNKVLDTLARTYGKEVYQFRDQRSREIFMERVKEYLKDKSPEQKEKFLRDLVNWEK